MTARQYHDPRADSAIDGVPSLRARRDVRLGLTVVLGALRHNDQIARLHFLLLPSDDRFADPRSEDQVLIDMMDLSISPCPNGRIQ